MSECSKLAFNSERAAKESRGARRNQGAEMRAYFCDKCHHWHLTADRRGTSKQDFRGGAHQ